MRKLFSGQMLLPHNQFVASQDTPAEPGRYAMSHSALKHDRSSVFFTQAQNSPPPTAQTTILQVLLFLPAPRARDFLAKDEL